MIEQTLNKRYKPVLFSFMGHMNGQQYDAKYNFILEEFLAINPDAVARYMIFKAYGTEEPAPDARSNGRRSSSLYYWKKTLSFYMPNRLISWNVIGGQGNPTRSIDVNNIIAKVKKKEVQKQGKPSPAHASLEVEEFEEAQKMFMEEYGEANIVRRCGIPCLVIFQFHLISWINYSTPFLISNLSLNPDFYFTL